VSTKQFIGSIDQGTTSTRCIIFDQQGDIIAMDQREHEQIYPKAGWVEHNPLEIWRNTQHVVAEALKKAKLTAADIAAVGITNQRETTLLWDKATGQPLYNALVWMDTRTADLVAQYTKERGADRLRSRTGLPITTYFSGLKLRWILDNVPGVREKAEAGEALFGTIDTWLAWNLTGGPKGGIHITDVTNASRTQLMDIASLQWDQEILDLFHIPRACLPEIRSSSEVYGEITVRSLNGVKLAGILGDQQAALFGQACLEPGAAKNTYGTGCFMLMNTGDKLVSSNYGLLTTVAYKLGDAPPSYALEGSIAITGALVQWLRDNLGIIRNSSDIETLARTVDDNGDVYFVPAFSGLYAPHWESSARGVIAGLTRFANKGHIARAALEASCYQVREVLEAMVKDSGVKISELRADGGMTVNDFVMQFQADILHVPVVRPKIVETTALGAAYSAGLAVGYWKSTEDVVENWQVGYRWHPKMPKKERESLFASWEKAVQRSLNWVD
jgi:glycerol kinase